MKNKLKKQIIKNYTYGIITNIYEINLNLIKAILSTFVL